MSESAGVQTCQARLVPQGRFTHAGFQQGLVCIVFQRDSDGTGSQQLLLQSGNSVALCIQTQL